MEFWKYSIVVSTILGLLALGIYLVMTTRNNVQHTSVDKILIVGGTTVCEFTINNQTHITRNLCEYNVGQSIIVHQDGLGIWVVE